MVDKIIGVISDTHNLLRPEIIDRLKSCDLIIHAGDIGEKKILEEINNIQKTIAVKGNTDRDPWTRYLKDTEYFEFCNQNIFIIHNLNQLIIDPRSAGIDIIIYGHSHQPAINYHEQTLYLNPGSAGPRRFKLPVSMAYLHISENKINPEIIEIEINEST